MLAKYLHLPYRPHGGLLHRAYRSSVRPSLKVNGRLFFYAPLSEQELTACYFDSGSCEYEHLGPWINSILVKIG